MSSDLLRYTSECSFVFTAQSCEEGAWRGYFFKLMFPLFKSLTQDRQDADLVFDSGWVHKSRDYIDDKVITF